MSNHDSFCYNQGDFPLLLLVVESSQLSSAEKPAMYVWRLPKLWFNNSSAQLSFLEGHSSCALTSPRVLFSAHLHLLFSIDVVESRTWGRMGHLWNGSLCSGQQWACGPFWTPEVFLHTLPSSLPSFFFQLLLDFSVPGFLSCPLLWTSWLMSLPHQGHLTLGFWGSLEPLVSSKGNAEGVFVWSMGKVNPWSQLWVMFLDNLLGT